MPYGPPYTVVFQIQLPKNKLGTSKQNYQLEKNYIEVMLRTYVSKLYVTFKKAIRSDWVIKIRSNTM